LIVKVLEKNNFGRAAEENFTQRLARAMLNLRARKLREIQVIPNRGFSQL